MRAAARILRMMGPETTPEAHWQSVVKPVFDFVWPFDGTLQTDNTTAALVDLAIAAGDAFAEAVSTLRPHLVPAWTGDHVWHYDTDFNERGVELLSAHPKAGLILLDSLIPADTGPTRLNELLDVVVASDPSLAIDTRFVRLRGLARRLAA
jgi:hypothetical protein